MPIRAFLNGAEFDAETTRVMGVAFEMARSALRSDGHDDAVVARKIIELAQAGERNPDLLCEKALERLRTEQSLSMAHGLSIEGLDGVRQEPFS
jgi:hypothetical protein